MIIFITDMIIILIFQTIGVTARTLKHIGDTRKQSPALSPKEVWQIIKQKDWDVYMGSVMILFLHLAIHAVMFIRHVELKGWMSDWWATMAVATVAGYAGQDVFIRWLGTATKKALEIAGGGSKSEVTVTETNDSITTKVESTEIKAKP